MSKAKGIQNFYDKAIHRGMNPAEAKELAAKMWEADPTEQPEPKKKVTKKVAKKKVSKK